MIDICDTFGPLAAMHAALDRAGAGMPCGLVARFPDRCEAELEAAIERANERYPILRTRLVWRQGRPMLDKHDTARRTEDTAPLLGFSSGDEGRTWRYRLVPAGQGVWLQAVWGHAFADGLSMLRFLQTISTQIEGCGQVEDVRRPCRPARVQPFLQWLPRFLQEQRRDYVSLAAQPLPWSEASWLIASPGDRDRLLDTARTACGGMLGWLAAATAKAFAEQQKQADGTVLLNVPILRSTLADTNGFGFGAGSLRFPVRLDSDAGMETLADDIIRKMRALAEAGWDRNLERLLGNNPARHRRFAAIEAKRPPDPNLTVSWKGVHRDVGAGQGPKDVACFAAAPTLHVSAHADANGLSISVTSRQSDRDRRALLERIARHLGCVTAYPIFDLRTSEEPHPPSYEVCEAVA